MLNVPSGPSSRAMGCFRALLVLTYYPGFLPNTTVTSPQQVTAVGLRKGKRNKHKGGTATAAPTPAAGGGPSLGLGGGLLAAALEEMEDEEHEQQLPQDVDGEQEDVERPQAPTAASGNASASAAGDPAFWEERNATSTPGSCGSPSSAGNSGNSSGPVWEEATHQRKNKKRGGKVRHSSTQEDHSPTPTTAAALRSASRFVKNLASSWSGRETSALFPRPASARSQILSGTGSAAGSAPDIVDPDLKDAEEEEGADLDSGDAPRREQGDAADGTAEESMSSAMLDRFLYSNYNEAASFSGFYSPEWEESESAQLLLLPERAAQRAASASTAQQASVEQCDARRNVESTPPGGGGAATPPLQIRMKDAGSHSRNARRPGKTSRTPAVAAAALSSTSSRPTILALVTFPADQSHPLLLRGSTPSGLSPREAASARVPPPSSPLHSPLVLSNPSKMHAAAVVLFLEEGVGNSTAKGSSGTLCSLEFRRPRSPSSPAPTPPTSGRRLHFGSLEDFLAWEKDHLLPHQGHYLLLRDSDALAADVLSLQKARESSATLFDARPPRHDLRTLLKHVWTPPPETPPPQDRSSFTLQVQQSDEEGGAAVFDLEEPGISDVPPFVLEEEPRLDLRVFPLACLRDDDELGSGSGTSEQEKGGEGAAPFVLHLHGPRPGFRDETAEEEYLQERNAKLLQEMHASAGGGPPSTADFLALLHSRSLFPKCGILPPSGEPGSFGAAGSSEENTGKRQRTQRALSRLAVPRDSGTACLLWSVDGATVPGAEDSSCDHAGGCPPGLLPSAAKLEAKDGWDYTTSRVDEGDQGLFHSFVTGRAPLLASAEDTPTTAQMEAKVRDMISRRHHFVPNFSLKLLQQKGFLKKVFLAAPRIPLVVGGNGVVGGLVQSAVGGNQVTRYEFAIPPSPRTERGARQNWKLWLVFTAEAFTRVQTLQKTRRGAGDDGTDLGGPLVQASKRERDKLVLESVFGSELRPVDKAGAYLSNAEAAQQEAERYARNYDVDQDREIAVVDEVEVPTLSSSGEEREDEGEASSTSWGVDEDEEADPPRRSLGRKWKERFILAGSSRASEEKFLAEERTGDEGDGAEDMEDVVFQVFDSHEDGLVPDGEGADVDMRDRSNDDALGDEVLFQHFAEPEHEHQPTAATTTKTDDIHMGDDHDGTKMPVVSGSGLDGKESAPALATASSIMTDVVWDRGFTPDGSYHTPAESVSPAQEEVVDHPVVADIDRSPPPSSSTALFLGPQEESAAMPALKIAALPEEAEEQPPQPNAKRRQDATAAASRKARNTKPKTAAARPLPPPATVIDLLPRAKLGHFFVEEWLPDELYSKFLRHQWRANLQDMVAEMVRRKTAAGSRPGGRDIEDLQQAPPSGSTALMLPPTTTTSSSPGSGFGGEDGEESFSDDEEEYELPEQRVFRAPEAPPEMQGRCKRLAAAIEDTIGDKAQYFYSAGRVAAKVAVPVIQSAMPLAPKVLSVVAEEVGKTLPPILEQSPALSSAVESLQRQVEHLGPALKTARETLCSAATVGKQLKTEFSHAPKQTVKTLLRKGKDAVETVVLPTVMDTAMRHGILKADGEQPKFKGTCPGSSSSAGSSGGLHFELEMNSPRNKNPARTASEPTAASEMRSYCGMEGGGGPAAGYDSESYEVEHPGYAYATPVTEFSLSATGAGGHNITGACSSVCAAGSEAAYSTKATSECGGARSSCGGRSLCGGDEDGDLGGLRELLADEYLEQVGYPEPCNPQPNKPATAQMYAYATSEASTECPIPRCYSRARSTSDTTSEPSVLGSPLQKPLFLPPPSVGGGLVLSAGEPAALLRSTSEGSSGGGAGGGGFVEKNPTPGPLQRTPRNSSAARSSAGSTTSRIGSPSPSVDRRYSFSGRSTRVDLEDSENKEDVMVTLFGPEKTRRAADDLRVMVLAEGCDSVVLEMTGGADFLPLLVNPQGEVVNTESRFHRP